MGMAVQTYTYRKKRPQMNPIWRGIGCLLVVIVPLISYGLTSLADPNPSEDRLRSFCGDGARRFSDLGLPGACPEPA